MRAIDGDTIKIEGGQVVRYIGIDAPETVDPSEPVGCYAQEASTKNKELVE
jgi:micrococcal nuclease